ncbi:hypothetical protein BC830DRAFT_1107790 [Chytriomyces sp. MP71]|nr:hypothetical protein BC830DRAFT_1107790 [Chytriomyces sp. MP71]
MRNRQALEENKRVMESLRDLDADVESICACWVRPAPDTPVSVNPVYVVERGTLIVRLFYAQTDSGEMLNMLFDAGCTPCGNERNPDMSGIGARWPSYVPYQHPFLVSHSVILSPSSCGFIPLARGDWRVVVEVKDRCARVLGDRVRKVVETDVAGRIHRLIVGEFC